MATNTIQPQFTHDSSCCQFLGRSADGTHDLYTCDAAGYRTYLARYGNDGPEYTASPDFSQAANQYIREARASFVSVSA